MVSRLTLSRTLQTPLLRACACAALLFVSATGASAQNGPPAAPFDTAGLGTGPGSTMGMLYERTFLNVDVLRLTLRFDDETAAEIADNIAVSEDSVVEAAIDSRHAVIRCAFLRDVELDQFLEGLRRNLERALIGGIIDQAAHDAILADVDVQYQPVAERGFRNGDIMWYRIRGDTLDIVLQTADGEELVRQQAAGPERRRATLAGFLAPGSSFREGLLESVEREAP